jgi:hypothetical protein
MDERKSKSRNQTFEALDQAKLEECLLKLIVNYGHDRNECDQIVLSLLPYIKTSLIRQSCLINLLHSYAKENAVEFTNSVIAIAEDLVTKGNQKFSKLLVDYLIAPQEQKQVYRMQLSKKDESSKTKINPYLY